MIREEERNCPPQADQPRNEYGDQAPAAEKFEIGERGKTTEVTESQRRSRGGCMNLTQILHPLHIDLCIYMEISVPNSCND